MNWVQQDSSDLAHLARHCGLWLGLPAYKGLEELWTGPSSCGPSSSSPLAGLVLRVTAEWQVQPKGKLPGLWKPRIGACIVSLLPHSVDQSRSQTSSDSRRGETDSTSLGEELQSIVAILQSTESSLETSQHLLPSCQAHDDLPILWSNSFISSFVTPGLFIQDKEPDYLE